jgi:predicted MFS family arabinose efflux permease
MPYRLLFFLTAINILNYFDRYIVQAVEPLLKESLRLSNSQSGLLGAAFVVGYCVFSPLFGYLGNRLDRKLLMAAGLVAWSLFTAVTGLATGFLSFFLARALVGVGEASFGAIVPGYLKGRISDTIQLNSALSLFYVAIPVGSALGYVAGGAVAARFGWQSMFLLACVPGLILSLGFFFVRPETKEERGSDPAAEVAGFVPSVKKILVAPVLCATIVGYIFNTFALNGIAMFVVRHLVSLGLSEAEGAAYFGGMLAVTGFIGALGGGHLASIYAAKSANPTHGLLRFVSITTLAGSPFLALAFCVDTPLTFFAACFVAELALFAGVAPLNTVLVARAPLGLETLTQGVTIFLIQFAGAALAPVVIGFAADSLPGLGVIQNAMAYALQIATVAMTISGLIWLRAARLEGRGAPASP